MSDTINRRDAINALDCDITITGKENADVVVKTIQMFVDRIKALPPAQPQQWIPCSEKMPPVGKTVVVTVKTDTEIWTGLDTWYQGNWMGYCGQGREVIAWMPLPEPYREEHG